jgi:hypothetical protein
MENSLLHSFRTTIEYEPKTKTNMKRKSNQDFCLDVCQRKNATSRSGEARVAFIRIDSDRNHQVVWVKSKFSVHTIFGWCC